MTPALDQIDVVAKNLDAAVAFYRLLGVRIPSKAIRQAQSGGPHIAIELPNGLTLAFDTPALARAFNRGYRSGRGGTLVIGFSVATRRAVDAAYARLIKAGHKGLQPPFDAFWGARYAVVADPDGNHVGLMSPSDPKRRGQPPDL